MFARLLELLKKTLIYAVLPLTVLLLAFFVGEQFEVGRLGAIASCEGSANQDTCLRSKGYLSESPYYPDLGRRYLGGYARLIGGDLGAAYKEKLPPPSSATENVEPPPAAPVAPAPPPLPLPPVKR